MNAKNATAKTTENAGKAAKAAGKAAKNAVAATSEGSSTRIGIVESDARDKTRKVVFPNSQMHPKYGKIIRKRTVLHVHDESNESHVGDVVEVASCRPISKTKSWKLVRIVRQGAARFQAVEVAPKETK